MSAYMKARAADAAGDSAAAAHDYAAALAAAPDNPLIAIRAYREGLEAGDLALADRAAAVLRQAGVVPADAALQPLALAAAQNDPAAAEAALVALRKGALAPLAPGLAGWIAFARHADPFALLDLAGKDLVARRFAGESRALLLIASGRTDEGVTAVRALRSLDDAQLDLRVNAAQLLIGQGHVDVARALLQGDDPVIERLRDQPGRGRKPTLGFGVSQLLTRIGADLAGGDPSPLVIALGRAALRADPANDRARLLLASELARDGARDRALAALHEVDQRGPFAAAAHSAEVGLLADGDDPKGALAAARALALHADAEPYDIQRYGRLLMAAKRRDEAAAQFVRLAQANPTEVTDWLQLAEAYDQGGHWPEARTALQRALALSPDDPLALNYLGYAQIAHHEEVAASQAMLEKAAKLRPDDASITDSLAWAYFQRGQVVRALPMLEKALHGEPENGVIAEHLGDAYWATGRRFEARYTWRVAALLADGGADGDRLSAKIAHGPDGAGATP